MVSHIGTAHHHDHSSLLKPGCRCAASENVCHGTRFRLWQQQAAELAGATA